MRGSKFALLKHFDDNGSITSMEAFSKYGITRLSARILELRKLGYKIDTVMMETTTRLGERCRYAKYVYKGKEDEQ